MNKLKEGAAHIILDAEERPRVIKKYGIHYIIAPTPDKAAEMWLELLYDTDEA